MSYNGSGTFQINTSGQPVVTGTVISSSAFNALTADLATGLSTAITKDGQTATTVRIPFAQGINSSLATDTSSGSTGSIFTAGGVGIAKALYVGTNATVVGTLGVTGAATFSATPVFSALTASSAVATDASKNLVSVTNTGTGNNVLATSPTLVTPVLGAASATSVTVAAGAVGTPSITTTGDTNTGIFFPAADTIAFAEGGAEAMRITSAGDVGIGNTSPSAKLTVSGFISSGGQNYSGLFTDAVNSTYSIAHQSGLTNLITDTAMAFYASNTERARITSDGRFYVNQTAGNGNTAQRMGLTYNGAAEWALAIQTTEATGGNAISFQNSSGTQVGVINQTNTATSYITSSDYRLKEDIAPMTGALAKVALLKPVTYKWKSDGSDAEGFIAHELAEVCPAAVHGVKDAINKEGNPEYQGIDTSFLVATLTAAIQELTARIVALEAK